MDEATIRLETEHVLREVGLWAYHPPDDNYDVRVWALMKKYKIPNSDFQSVKYMLFPKEHTVPGRPDIYGLNPRGATVVLEVKTIEPKKKIEPWINPNIISNRQRNWLDHWTIDSMGPGYIAFGTLEGSPRDLWIIPWEWWIDLENKLTKMRVPISMLPDSFKMVWNVGKKHPWSFPNFHPVLQYVTEACSPDHVDWKKTYSLRFEDGN